MDRRQLLTVLGGGILSGGLYTSNSIGEPALAANVSINNISIPENRLNSELQFKFTNFNLSTRNINTDNYITVKLYGQIENETGYILLYENNNISLSNRNNNFKSITSQLESVSLSNLNIYENINQKGDKVDIKFKLIINHDDINKITKKDNMTIEVIKSDIVSFINYNFENQDLSNWSDYGSAGSSNIVPVNSPVGENYAIRVRQNRGSGTSWTTTTNNSYDFYSPEEYYMLWLFKSTNFDGSSFLGTSLTWNGNRNGDNRIGLAVLDTDSNGNLRPFRFVGGGVSNYSTESINWTSGGVVLGKG